MDFLFLTDSELFSWLDAERAGIRPKGKVQISSKIPEDLKRAHDRNDEVLERIYIGRRFKNDTERLEKLFEPYTERTAAEA